MSEDQSPGAGALDLATLVEIVGTQEFERACAEAMSATGFVVEAPHDVADRLWYEGDEGLDARLSVAAELYRVMPCYGNLMYWRHPTFDERSYAHLWDLYREFVGDPNPSIAEPAMYSLWVDWFEDASTVDRAWRELAGPQEPRRPRLERVVSNSGPVPWELKGPLYEQLALEGGWEQPLLAGLYGSCIDIFGSLDRLPALSVFRRLPRLPDDPTFRQLEAALQDPRLPRDGAGRRMLVLGPVKRLR